jgi:hypothetical protein
MGYSISKLSAQQETALKKDITKILCCKHYFPVVQKQDLAWFEQENIKIHELSPDTLIIKFGDEWLTLSDLRLNTTEYKSLVRLELPKNNNDSYNTYHRHCELRMDSDTSSFSTESTGYQLRYYGIPLFDVSIIKQDEHSFSIKYENCNK